MLLDDFTADELNELIEIYSSEYGGILSPDEAFEEICCDALGRMNIFEGTDLNSESYGKAQDTVRKYAAERTGSKGRAPPKGGVMFSRQAEDKYFARQIDQWDGKDHGGAFRVGGVSEPLLKVGIPNTDIWFDQSKAAKQLLEKGEITKAVIKQIPVILQHPIAISEPYDSTVMVFGQVFDATGNPIVVALRVNSTKRRNSITLVNKIRSVGSRSHNLDKLLNDSNILYLGENKKETKAWFNALGRSTPFGGTKFGLIRSVSFADTAVKKFSMEAPIEDSNGRRLTNAQREFFKDSKAIDSNGRLLRLYHGTGAKFTVFDKVHIGENFGNRGGDLGFYFSPYIEDEKGYARESAGYKGKGEVMPVYLNLKNPLIIEDDGWGSAISQADIRHGDLKRWAEEGKHDGIIVKSTDEIDENDMPDAVYIAFSPEQIKNVTNENPTSNPDIRYSREQERLNELRQQNERKLAQAAAEDAANENERGLDLKASLVFYVLCICRGCRFGIVRGRTLHADLQQQRSYKGRHYDHEDYRGEHRSGYEPGHAALLCNYQRDLAARYHAEADGDGVVGLEAGEPCTDAAADDLGDDGDEGQDNCEQNEVAVKPGKLGFYADGGKEYRGEEHITHRVYTLDYIGSRLAVVAEHDAGKVRAGYIGDAEEVLGNKAEQEAEGKRVDGYAPVDAVKPRAQSAKQLVHDDRHDGKEDKIRDDADKYHGRLNGGVREAREHGQNDDAEHVVNDGGGHDRCADAAFELAHLTQSLDRYRHRGSGQNDADERGLYHFKAVRLAVEQKITARTAEKRHDNADRGYDESRQPRMLELLEVRIEAGHEHEDDNADLGGLYEKVRFADEPEAARPEQQTRDQRAYDLRHVDLFARNAENFC